MIRRGYVRHLLLLHNCNRDHEMRYGGGYCHIFASLLPRLQEHGIMEEDIQTVMAVNPA
jgi:predicted metal-dependent phosphotriesterase family hydrolase